MKVTNQSELHLLMLLNVSSSDLNVCFSHIRHIINTSYNLRTLLTSPVLFVSKVCIPLSHMAPLVNKQASLCYRSIYSSNPSS